VSYNFFLWIRYIHVLVAITHYFSSQPFTDYFPRADIHELISPDILHQLVKGAFKDHVVTWIHSYIKAKHGEQAGNSILDDIDRRYFFSPKIYGPKSETIFSIALAPPFAGLRRFPEGRGFKQWTGDDSKALMKVRYGRFNYLCIMD